MPWQKILRCAQNDRARKPIAYSLQLTAKPLYVILSESEGSQMPWQKILRCAQNDKEEDGLLRRRRFSQ